MANSPVTLYGASTVDKTTILGDLDITNGVISRQDEITLDVKGILSNYQSLILSEPSLIAYWKMDESLWNGTDGEVVDTKNGYNGTSVGGATTTTSYKYGTHSGNFDGINDYISVPSSSAFNFGTNDFTIEWWEYRVTPGGGRGAISRDSSVYVPFMLGWSNLIYMSSDGANWDIAAAQSLGSVILNNWVHYAVTRSGNNFYAYQNGLQTDTWISNLSLLASADPMVFGSAQGAGFYQGRLDEIAIYNSALSQTTITNHAHLGGHTHLHINNSVTDFVDIHLNGNIYSNNISLDTLVEPTARLHIPAGTALAGTAPLKLEAGTLLTTPENGTIEFDGTHFYGTIAGVRVQLDNV